MDSILYTLRQTHEGNISSDNYKSILQIAASVAKDKYANLTPEEKISAIIQTIAHTPRSTYGDTSKHSLLESFGLIDKTTPEIILKLLDGGSNGLRDSIITNEIRFPYTIAKNIDILLQALLSSLIGKSEKEIQSELSFIKKTAAEANLNLRNIAIVFLRKSYSYQQSDKSLYQWLTIFRDAGFINQQDDYSLRSLITFNLNNEHKAINPVGRWESKSTNELYIKALKHYSPLNHEAYMNLISIASTEQIELELYNTVMKMENNDALMTALAERGHTPYIITNICRNDRPDTDPILTYDPRSNELTIKLNTMRPHSDNYPYIDIKLRRLGFSETEIADILTQATTAHEETKTYNDLKINLSQQKLEYIKQNKDAILASSDDPEQTSKYLIFKTLPEDDAEETIDTKYTTNNYHNLFQSPSTLKDNKPTDDQSNSPAPKGKSK